MKNADKYYGKKIVAVAFNEAALRLTFDDKITIAIFDDGQSCCEDRYMSTDDSIQSIVNQILTRIEVKEADDIDDEDNVHEVCFLEIGTNQGFITISSHNVHNGYYSGFNISIKEE